MKQLPIVLAAFLITGLLLCQAKPDIIGSGVIKKETRTTGSFSKILVSNAIQLILTQADYETITVETDDNILPYVIVSVNNDKLNIETKDTHTLSTKAGIKVYVSYKHITELFASGASKVSVTNLLKEDKLLLILSSASQADFNIKAQWLSVNCSAASKAILKGTAEKLNIQCAGASNINAEKLIAQEADADAVDASTVTLNTHTRLTITASGASMVRYFSEPTTVITKNISGASSAISLSQKSAATE